jgi:hypothetical protein
MLKNRKERFIEEVMKKSIHENDSKQLSTCFESSFSQIISLRFEMTEDDKISRFQLKDAEESVKSSNVIVRRKNKEKKPIEFNQLLAINQHH